VKDSTKRSLRTLVQGIIAAAVAAPAIFALLPTTDANVLKIEASVVAGAAIVSKLYNLLEERGLLPAWLKGDSATVAHVAGDDAGDGELALLMLLAQLFCYVAVGVAAVIYVLNH
jgi:hypothetical protein